MATDTTTTARLDDEWRNLLESSTNLNITHNASRINRSLVGIEKEAQRLSSKSSRHVPANQLKDFAAQCGVDIRNQTQYISSIHTIPPIQRKQQEIGPMTTKPVPATTTKPVPLISGSIHPTNTMDLNNFLKYHHEHVISSTIQECQLLNSRHFRKKYNESIQCEWNKTKNDILNYLGCNQQSNYSQNNQIQQIEVNQMRMPQIIDSNSRNDDNDDIMMNMMSNNNMNNNNNLNIELQDKFGKIICDLSNYRNLSAPIMDFDRNRNNDQYISRTNIFSPISQFGIIHRQIYEEYKNRDLYNKNGTDNNNLLLLQYLCDLWQCLSSMIFETGINREKQCYLKENEYKRYYEDNNIGLQRLFINGSRKYLEKMYFDFIESEISKNKNFAKKGGKPGKRYIILAFIRLKYQNGSVIPNEYTKIRIKDEIFPLWPLIYYSYRIGDIDSCIYFTKFHETSQIIGQSLNNYREKQFKLWSSMNNNNNNNNNNTDDMDEIIKIYENDNNFDIDSNILKKLDSYFKENIIKKSLDPFEILMYILIGKICTNHKYRFDDILNRQEDFLWFKLSTLYLLDDNGQQRQSDNKSDNIWIPSITLQSLQNEIKRDIGPSSFDNRILFAMSLLLSQQFEDCIEYLSLYYPLQSIHLGICLNFYGLLHSNNSNNRAIHNLSVNIIKYIDRFKQQTSKQHLIYFYLYIINNTENGLISFLSEPNKNLRQLIIGTFTNDAINIENSLLLKFEGIDKFISICSKSADTAYKNGEIEHCIILYILCGDFNESTKICIKLLSSHISDKPFNHSKQFIVNLAKQIFKSNKQILENNNFHSLSLIDKQRIKLITNNNSFNLISCIHFAEFYDLYYQQNYDKALKIIYINGLIPICDEDIMKLEQNENINNILLPYKNKILSLDNDLKKYIGEICVALMQILFSQFNESAAFNKSNGRLSKKCKVIYTFFNQLESQIKPIGAGDTAKKISNLYYQTRID